jgi:hypothetical protein
MSEPPLDPNSVQSYKPYLYSEAEGHGSEIDKDIADYVIVYSKVLEVLVG